MIIELYPISTDIDQCFKNCHVFIFSQIFKSHPFDLTPKRHIIQAQTAKFNNQQMELQTQSQDENTATYAARFLNERPTTKQLSNFSPYLNTFIFQGLSLSSNQWRQFFSELGQTQLLDPIRDLRFELCNLKDRHISKFCEIFPKITSLSFINCEITDGSVQKIIKTYPYLQQLTLSQNATTKKAAVIIAQNAKHLKKLAIDKVDDGGVGEICAHLTDLTTLVIDDNSIGSDSLLKIVRSYFGIDELAVRLQYGQILAEEVDAITSMGSSLVVWYYHPSKDSSDDGG